MSAKKVFISYSHDSKPHKKWVCELATLLYENGLEVIFDQWGVDYGDDIAAFMEEGIGKTDIVLVICTDAYVDKANQGVGGVGYEKTICTAKILQCPKNRPRFIPILRDINGSEKVPTFLGALKYLDLSEGKDRPEIRKKLVESICKDPQQVLSHEKQKVQLQLPTLGQEPILEFSKRFGKAFPGLRGVQWFEDANVIAERLGTLLSQPLIFDEGYLAWWWRGPENMQICNFEHVEGRHFQMDYHELKIRRIAAVNRTNIYYRKFVYVETSANSPTGLYATTNENKTQAFEQFGYYCEEYGLVDENLPITLAEYDDGATLIDGVIVDVTGRAVPRIRYITPYNFLIAPSTSPINNNKFDYELKAFLNQMLQGKGSFSEICDAIDALPKQN